MKIVGPLLFALIAAVGNAMYAAGQKKADISANNLAFIAISALIAALLALSVAPILGPPQYKAILKYNWFWTLLSGTGLLITFLGFNILYSRYGASHYVLYAVLSIITTAIIVGVIIFKENINLFHWMALGAAIIAIVLFSFGNRMG
ncbi:EamA family transporter [Xanthovirga aplysinae]|uniref:EamA family transporter n=1 Tax=Xanthovirga aplysinae TaxID=2529853 RepID=UPI0012BD51EF|nr:EamA family transporter [Xanthovirga aplysinae]MTI31782.1 transporter [Xanthovirga aplysinae]